MNIRSIIACAALTISLMAGAQAPVAPANNATPGYIPQFFAKKVGNKLKPTSDNLFLPPQYPGGEDALHADLNKAVRYPAAAQENGTQGTVVLNLFIDAEGKVAAISALQSPDNNLTGAAVQAAQKLNTFVPATLNGQPVGAWFAIPINFRLQ